MQKNTALIYPQYILVPSIQNPADGNTNVMVTLPVPLTNDMQAAHPTTTATAMQDGVDGQATTYDSKEVTNDTLHLTTNLPQPLQDNITALATVHKNFVNSTDRIEDADTVVLDPQVDKSIMIVEVDKQVEVIPNDKTAINHQIYQKVDKKIYQQNIGVDGSAPAMAKTGVEGTHHTLITSSPINTHNNIKLAGEQSIMVDNFTTPLNDSS
uniref:Cellulose synthase A catalytic subunit 7 [UDP-forming] n=2 Tax=Lygus hesperus TaxID=30085 RepID=A0A0A9YC61_LYGHE